MPCLKFIKEVTFFTSLLLSLQCTLQAPQNDVLTSGRGERCFTPSNEVGTCVRLEDCQSLLALGQKPAQSRATYYLEKSTCKTDNLKCCPNRDLKNPSRPTSSTQNSAPIDFPTNAPNSTEFVTPVWPPTSGSRPSTTSSRPTTESRRPTSSSRPTTTRATWTTSTTAESRRTTTASGSTTDEFRPTTRGSQSTTTMRSKTTSGPNKSQNLTRINERMKLLPSDCGKREVSPLQRKVVGGEPAVLGEYPWIVALGFRNQFIADAVPKWSCAGTLITDRHVVTAAHCARNGRNMIMFVARVGELNLDENVQDGASPEDIPIKKVIVHPSYDRGLIVSSYANDIAMAVLERSVSFSRNVGPICLPVLQENRNRLFEGQLSQIAGWGSKEFRGPATLELLRAQLPVVSTAQCKTAYAEERSAVIDERVICAGIDTGAIDTCQGDSGGPLMTELNDTFNLIGVVSFGIGCGKANTPGVYTRTTAFLDWILDVIENQSTR
nr:PREDICTED: venom serine protease Bi-VSP-like [Bemisia tabaci]XP_018907782.1 PREDICTED: venom serine protease Bi-VSP-like [Bemisia tabaci]